MQSGSDDWYIADNTIVGDKIDVRVLGDFGGEGIELEHTNGQTVCYNSISRVADGVSYMNRKLRYLRQRYIRCGRRRRGTGLWLRQCACVAEPHYQSPQPWVSFQPCFAARGTLSATR